MANNTNLDGNLRVFYLCLAIAGLLISQIGGGAWVFSSWNEKLANTLIRVAALEQKTEDRYRSTDAARELAIRDSRISRNERDITSVLAAVTVVDNKVATIDSKVTRLLESRGLKTD